MDKITIRHGLKQIGEALMGDETMDNIDGLVEGLQSGEWVLAPVFMKYPDGKIRLIEVSIIPREASLVDPPVNAKELEDRCDAVFRGVDIVTRCTLKKGHTGMHIGANDTAFTNVNE